MLGRVTAGEVGWNAAHPAVQKAPDQLRNAGEGLDGVIAGTRQVLQ